MAGGFDAGAVVGRLELGLAGWKKSVEAVKKDQQSLSGFAMRHREEIEKLGKGFTLVGGAIVASLGAAVIKTASFGGELDDLSQRTGIATEILSGYKLAADNSGTSLEGLAAGLRSLSRNMVEASAGTGAAKDAFDFLGVSVVNADGTLRDSNEVMLDVAERFKHMEGGAQKTALSMDIFGKSGANLIPMLNKGRDGLGEIYKNAERFGMIVSQDAASAAAKFNDSLNNLKSSLQGAGTAIGQTLMPSVKTLVDGLTGVVALFTNLFKAMGPIGELIVSLAAGFGTLTLATGATMVVLAKILKSLPELKLAASMLGLSFQGLTKDALSLSGALKGLPLIGAAGLTGWKIGEAINDLSGLRKAFQEVDWHIEGMQPSAAKAMQALRGLLPLIGDNTLSVNKLKAEYGSFEDALDAVLVKYADQIKAGQESKAQTTELAAAMELLGIKTRDVAQKELDALVTAYELAAKSGDVNNAALVLGAEKAAALADAYGLKLSPTMRNFSEGITATNKQLEELVRYSTDLALKNMPAFGRAIERVAPPIDNVWRMLGQVAQTIKDGNIPATYQLERRLDYLSNQMGVSVATIQLMILKLSGLSYWMGNLEFPALQPKLDTKEFESGCNAMEQAWANMVTDIAQGWSAAFVDMFGLTAALIGESTKHIQEYFDGALADLEASKEAQLAAYDGIYEAIQETYRKAKDEVSAYYDELDWRANDALEDEKKRMRREYEDKRDHIMATVPASAERDEMLKALAREYEDAIDDLERQHEEEDRQRKADELAAVEALNAQKKAEEEKLAAEKLAIEEAYQVELARIRADEERSREEHAASELKRQNSLWTKMKTAFGSAVEAMLTTWLTGFVAKQLASITDKILPAMDTIGERGVSVGETAGKALSGIGKAIEDICTAILDVIEDIAKTVVDIVAYALETLAESIANAAKSLAAAAPDLLIVGAVALLLYAGFEAINALIGSGGGGSGDGMGRVVERQDRFLAVWDWWAPDVVAILSFIQGQNDRRADQLDNLAGCINSAADRIVGAIDGIPGAAEGALVTGPTLVRVGENAPGEQEVIMPLPELGSFARNIAAAGAGGAYAGGGEHRNVQVHIKPILIDKGDKWMIKFIQESFIHGDLYTPVNRIGAPA